MKYLLSFLVVFFFSVAATGQASLGRVSKQVNFREGPGTDYKIIKPLNQGAQVFIISSNLENDFYNIIDINSNKEGYVHKSYIKIEKDLPKNSDGIFNPKGSTGTYNAEIEIYNKTSKTLTLRLNKEVYTFLPKEKRTLSLVPGTYNYIASAPSVMPDYGNESLDSNSAYTWQFYIATSYK